MVIVLQEMGVKSKFAVVHASSRDRLRMWLPDRMAAVIDHLVEQHDLFVVITGATADKDDNNEICKYVRNSDCIVNAAGAFSLEQLPALMTIARLLVTVDTGPMHIAATVSTPIVALFRPIYADMHYPFNQANNVVIANESLYEADSGELPLSNISIEAVKTKIDDVMRISEDNRNPNSREANSNAK
jgi:ADP-heptose:LPS heptosyltransferase